MEEGDPWKPSPARAEAHTRETGEFSHTFSETTTLFPSLSMNFDDEQLSPPGQAQKGKYRSPWAAPSYSPTSNEPVDIADPVPESLGRRKSSVSIAMPRRDPANLQHVNVVELEIPESDPSPARSPYRHTPTQKNLDHAEIQRKKEEAKAEDRKQLMVETMVTQECEQVLQYELRKSLNNIMKQQEQKRVIIARGKQQIDMLRRVLQQIRIQHGIDVDSLVLAETKCLPPIIANPVRQLRLPKLPDSVTQVAESLSQSSLSSESGDGTSEGDSKLPTPRHSV